MITNIRDAVSYIDDKDRMRARTVNPSKVESMIDRINDPRKLIGRVLAIYIFYKFASTKAPYLNIKWVKSRLGNRLSDAVYTDLENLTSVQAHDIFLGIPIDFNAIKPASNTSASVQPQTNQTESQKDILERILNKKLEPTWEKEESYELFTDGSHIYKLDGQGRVEVRDCKMNINKKAEPVNKEIENDVKEDDVSFFLKKWLKKESFKKDYYLNLLKECLDKKYITEEYYNQSLNEELDNNFLFNVKVVKPIQEKGKLVSFFDNNNNLLLNAVIWDDKITIDSKDNEEHNNVCCKLKPEYNDAYEFEQDLGNAVSQLEENFDLKETYSKEELDSMIGKTYNIQKIQNIYRREKYNDSRLFAHTRCVNCGREKRVYLSNLINDPDKYGSCVCSNTNVESRLDNITGLYDGSKKLSNNTSGYTGISYVKVYNGRIYDKWRAYIDIDHKRTYLGDFDSKTDAIKARKEAASKGIKWYKDNRDNFIKNTRKKTKRYRTKRKVRRK